MDCERSQGCLQDICLSSWELLFAEMEEIIGGVDLGQKKIRSSIFEYV